MRVRKQVRQRGEWQRGTPLGNAVFLAADTRALACVLHVRVCVAGQRHISACGHALEWHVIRFRLAEIVGFFARHQPLFNTLVEHIAHEGINSFGNFFKGGQASGIAQVRHDFVGVLICNARARIVLRIACPHLCVSVLSRARQKIEVYLIGGDV